MQLDVTSSQLLVTDGLFRDASFRKQLTDTVNSLLELRVIPIFNENDAVSTRKAPYEVCWNSRFTFNHPSFSRDDERNWEPSVTPDDLADLKFKLVLLNQMDFVKMLTSCFNIQTTIWFLGHCDKWLLIIVYLQDSSGIFWDNDSLAGLLALELKADLLVLLSDVEGLYSGPPSDPKSKLIHTYVKQKHQEEITFGDKSRLGRGGMTAKVNAAVCAAEAGTPVIITRYSPIFFTNISICFC